MKANKLTEQVFRTSRNLRYGSMEASELQEHIFRTYLNLRYGMAIIAFAFPLILFGVGRIYGISLQSSMSHYYFALPPDDLSEKDFSMRVWFVGILFAIGVFLYLYKGFSRQENIALNLAGIFALGVALFPLDVEATGITVHGFCAVFLFLCVAFVSVVCARETLYLLKNPKLEASFRRKYYLFGGLMIASPLIALGVTMLSHNLYSYTFYVETAGTWAFALYWWTKSKELSLSGAEKFAVAGKINPNEAVNPNGG